MLKYVAAMKKRKAIAGVSALLIAGFLISQGQGPSLASEIDPPEITRSSACCSDSNSSEIDRSDLAICPGCSINDVEIADKDFTSNCICIGYKTITLGPNVTIKKDVSVIFSAPKVYIKSYFHAEPGSVVSIETEEPPPPPG
jgi:hypothetical protein